MDVIKWRDSYETGIVPMDEEHKRIIEVISRLYKMIRDTEGERDLNSIYTTLAEYSEHHFQHEEELLEKHDYPEMAEQRESHREFIKKLQEIRAELEENSDTVLPEVYKYLRDWWINHIMGTDSKYCEFLKEKGE